MQSEEDIFKRHGPDKMKASVTWLKDLRNDAYTVGAKWLYQSQCHCILLRQNSSAPPGTDESIFDRELLHAHTSQRGSQLGRMLFHSETSPFTPM